MHSPTIHCINPQCPHPSGQPWGNKFCQSCGAPLLLNQRYIPLHSLGSGGFSRLYTVWDLNTQTEKVLKVLVEPSPKALELFEQEAHVLGRLHHPGVPKVEADGYFYLKKRQTTATHLPCLVMEKIHGPTLQEILNDYPQGCPEDWVISWLSQALDILRELHGYHIIHRDIKPSNLMLRMMPQSPLSSTQIWQTQLVMIDFGGAKQIGPIRHSDRENTPRSTTRLVSAGYSPPEQVLGALIAPATDFYALGRTCIHLLTGQFPGELDDALTGEFRWRDKTQVSPWFADLLDQMVQLDPRQRPQTATEIQTHLFKIARLKKRPRRGMSWAKQSLDVIKTTLIQLDRRLAQGIINLGKLTLHCLRGVVETTWAMAFSTMGGVIGAFLGVALAYGSGLGDVIQSVLAEELPNLLPNVPIALGPEVLIWGMAGLSTAIGLTTAGGFEQRRRYLLAGFMGILAYTVGGASGQLIDQWAGVEFQAWELEILEKLNLGIATGLLTLGLGLGRDHLLQALMVTLGTILIFWGGDQFNLLPDVILHFPSAGEQVNLLNSVRFMALLSCTTAFCLGVSHYLFLPLFRWFK